MWDSACVSSRSPSFAITRYLGSSYAKTSSCPMNRDKENNRREPTTQLTVLIPIGYEAGIFEASLSELSNATLSE